MKLNCCEMIPRVLSHFQTDKWGGEREKEGEKEREKRERERRIVWEESERKKWERERERERRERERERVKDKCSTLSKQSSHKRQYAGEIKAPVWGGINGLSCSQTSHQTVADLQMFVPANVQQRQNTGSEKRGERAEVCGTTLQRLQPVPELPAPLQL